MGYSHYWNRPRIIQPSTFIAIGNDLRILLPALENAGAPIANAYGREEPEIGPEFIGFNGVECCGHEKNLEVKVPWPTDDAHGIGSNHGIGGTLPYRTCNGECSYESLWFERCPEPQSRNGRIDGGCKTAFRPYDLAVTAFLVIAKHHMKGAFTVETDGTPRQWAEAFALCQEQLGYGAGSRFLNEKLVVHEEALCG